MTVVWYLHHSCDICTIRDTFRYMTKPHSWGDHATLNALSLWWGAKIAVVVAKVDRIFENKIHCSRDLPLEKADFVLVYNGSTHYSAACKYHS